MIAFVAAAWIAQVLVAATRPVRDDRRQGPARDAHPARRVAVAGSRPPSSPTWR